MQFSPLNSATAALRRLVVERVITTFTANFDRRQESGFFPRVIVTIRDQDELAIERAKRRVQAELQPLLGRVSLTVQPESASQ